MGGVVGRAGPHARSALLASRPVRRRCHSLHASSCLAPAAPEARSTAVRGPAHRAQQWLAGCSSPAPLPITWRPWLPRSHRVAPAGGARAHAAKVRGPVQRPVRGLPFSQAAPAGGGGAGSCAEAALQLGGSTLVGPGPGRAATAGSCRLACLCSIVLQMRLYASTSNVASCWLWPVCGTLLMPADLPGVVLRCRCGAWIRCGSSAETLSQSTSHRRRQPAQQQAAAVRGSGDWKQRCCSCGSRSRRCRKPW